MDADLSYFTGSDLRKHARELLKREYGQGEGVHETYVPNFQIEPNPYPTPQHTNIVESWTRDVDQGSDIEVDKWNRTTAKPVLANAAGQLQLGPAMEGGHFERSPDGVRKDEPAVSVARLVQRHGLPDGSWVAVEDYRRMNDPREHPPQTESRSLRFIRV